MTVSVKFEIAKCAAQIRREIGSGVTTYASGGLKAESGFGDRLTAILKAHGCAKQNLRDAVGAEASAQKKRRNERYPRLRNEGKGFAIPVLRDELARLRRVAVSSAACESLRADKIVPILTDDPSKVGASYSRRDMGAYSSRCSYHQYETTLTVTVPSRWRVRVERRGLAVVDGILTLDASPLDYRLEGIQVFAATWVTQGRGFSCEVVHGFIAKSTEGAYHADTPAKAIAGLKRKLKWAALPASTKSERVRHLTDWTIRAAKADPSTPVCLEDARLTGACEYGIRSWCNRVGLDYEAGCATLAEVLAGYEACPQPEVRAAVLHAIRGAKHGTA